MGKYVLGRLVQFVPTVCGVAGLTFLLIHLVPGDPIEVLLGEDALAADRVQLSARLGLDLPIWQQFGRYVGQLLHGRLGVSLFTDQPVAHMIAERLPATAELAGCALVFALLISFCLGIWAATRAGQWPDRFAMTFSLLGFSMPNFWLGPLLIVVFALWLGVLPVSGREGAASVVLPALTLGTGMAAILSRLLRSAMLDVLHADFMRTAVAKGVTRRRQVWHHALKNALLPVITVIFLQAGALLTGTILTEAVFAWPGLGSLMIEALNRRDYPVVQGGVLFIALVYVTMTLLADLLYAWADPRIRYGRHGR